MLICMCVLRTIQIKKQRISQYDRNSIILHWNLWKKASNTDIEYKKRMWLDFLLIGHLQWTCVCIWKNCQFHFSCQYILFFLRNNVYFPVFHWLQCKTREQVIHLIWICRCKDVISIKQNTAKKKYYTEYNRAHFPTQMNISNHRQRDHYPTTRNE